MLDTFLVPEKTVVSANGDGNTVDISSVQSRKFLLLLNISNAVEQQSLDVSIWASTDGQSWDAKPIASFPQAFYLGQHPLLLDLSQRSDAKLLRAHFEVNRWGRGSESPMFEFGVRLTEVVPEMLK